MKENTSFKKIILKKKNRKRKYPRTTVEVDTSDIDFQIVEQSRYQSSDDELGAGRKTIGFIQEVKRGAINQQVRIFDLGFQQ